MSEKQPNDIKMITWHLVAKNLIKFSDSETTYPLGENVIAKSDFVNYPLRKGDNVEVGIKDGVITFIKKTKSEAAKSEPKGSEEAYEPTPEEEAPKAEQPKAEQPKTEAPSSDTKELTIFAVATNKKVLKFIELKDDGWFQIAEDIQAQDYKEIGLIAKSKAQVKIVDKTVVSISCKPAEAKKETAKDTKTEQPRTQEKTDNTNPKKEFVPATEKDAFYYIKELERKIRFLEDNKQASIESQAAINAANDVVGRVAASISPAPTASVINSMINAIALSNFALIQELKKTK